MRSSNVTATSNCSRQSCQRCGARFTAAFRSSICTAHSSLFASGVSPGFGSVEQHKGACLQQAVLGVQVLVLAPQVVQDVRIRRPKRIHVGLLRAGAGQLHVPAHAKGLHLRRKRALCLQQCLSAHSGQLLLNNSVSESNKQQRDHRTSKPCLASRACASIDLLQQAKPYDALC